MGTAHSLTHTKPSFDWDRHVFDVTKLRKNNDMPEAANVSTYGAHGLTSSNSTDKGVGARNRPVAMLDWIKPMAVPLSDGATKSVANGLYNGAVRAIPIEPNTPETSTAAAAAPANGTNFSMKIIGS